MPQCHLFKQEGPRLGRITAGGEEGGASAVARDEVIDGHQKALPHLKKLDLIHAELWVGNCEDPALDRAATEALGAQHYNS